jgi:hypothetical protein
MPLRTKRHTERGRKSLRLRNRTFAGCTLFSGPGLLPGSEYSVALSVFNRVNSADPDAMLLCTGTGKYRI